MTVGLSVYDLAVPDLLELAAAAEDAGFDAIWLGEHVLLPVGYASEHPTHGVNGHEHITGPIVHPDTELVDPMVALAAAAGATRRIRLATGIYILPLRHPLVTARAAATLQEASAGRFLLGVGAGWLEEEFAALDVPFDQRAGRMSEAIEIMRAAWRGRPFEHRGTHFSFAMVQTSHRSAAVPLILGGNTPAALRRAARVGDGWFSSGTPSFEQAVELVATIRRERAAFGLTAPYRCYVRVPDASPAVLDRYAAAGIDDVVVWADQLWPATGTAAAKREAFATAAGRLGLTPQSS
jgi:probable F420-dependent oxidoreductase